MSMPRPPLSEMLSAIPGALGIRLEEEPRHEVIEQVEGAHGESVEIRRYAPALLAQVTVQGDHEHAMDAAFEKLAGYIYGRNASEEKMHMTTPVYQRASGDARVPVLQSGDGSGWTVAFFLANDQSPADVPAPSDPGITLVQAPESTVAVLRYTGNNDEQARAEARTRLLATVERATGWAVADDVVWAQYDQPFAVAFLKRNEAQVAVRPR